MNKELSQFAARARDLISSGLFQGENFAPLALELFVLQFENNFAYRKICEARKLTPQTVEHWTQIPAAPAGMFKELELTSLAPNERATVFHSSGTTEQKPSRHFHNAQSLAIYEASLWQSFGKNILDADRKIKSPELICLTPAPEQAANSSLVHMFETVRQKMSFPKNVFSGQVNDGVWDLDFEKTLALLSNGSKSEVQNPKLILGTAFSFVHLLDFLAENGLRFQLPENSHVMETGGYKNRSRTMSKRELHSLIEKFLGVPRENILCEYGMSELSSQAYAKSDGRFEFPAWARVRIISPETGREVADGETGLIRIFDLANVFSVAAIQTEDSGIRRENGFELIGRAQLAEPRGCSLMNA